jgi:hypothetical protein
MGIWRRLRKSFVKWTYLTKCVERMNSRTSFKSVSPIRSAVFAGRTSSEYFSMNQSWHKPPLIIHNPGHLRVRSNLPHKSMYASIGESNFRKMFDHFDQIRSHSQYRLFYANRHEETRATGSGLWAPALGHRSFEYDSGSDCLSCLELVEEIKLHRQMHIGRHGIRIPPIQRVTPI